MENKDEIKNNPAHVAIIIDGNGRWGIENWNDRRYGRLRGSEVVFEILATASDLGIRYFTVYALSLENRKRPKEEVDYLMNLFRTGFNEELVQKHCIRFKILGIRENLPKELIEYLHYLEKSARENTGMIFSFCLNYIKFHLMELFPENGRL
jgi:undecaprenyl diphosphate synthase